ncbi:MAG: TetR/AcrR family transcriptional regulator, partial [Gaiellaceae bacterium]
MRSRSAVTFRTCSLAGSRSASISAMRASMSVQVSRKIVCSTSSSYVAVSQEEKRRQILDAAVRAFARKGYHACRVGEIAEEAGVAYGLVYHYFRSTHSTLMQGKGARAGSTLGRGSCV